MNAPGRHERQDLATVVAVAQAQVLDSVRNLAFTTVRERRGKLADVF
jgi:hypothetical protein